MSYVIVGGGIAGLYSAYSLHKNFGYTNITVLEKDNRLGGKIYTIYPGDNVFLEMGAGGVIDVQKNVIELLAELKLMDKLMDSSGSRSLVIASSVPTSKYIDTPNNIVPTIYQITNIIDIKNSDFYDIMDTLNKKLEDKNFFQMALSYNLYALIEKLYGFEKADQLMYQFGYHADFHEQNAVEALGMFKREFSINAKFHRIDGGMLQIINALASYLNKNGIVIRLNTECINIDKITNKYRCILANGDFIETDNIIMAIPKVNIIGIKYFENIYSKLNSVIHKPLLRIYVYFPKINGKVWFDSINSTLTTKTLLSQIIPVNKDKGILMIYCDGLNATAWHYFEQNQILEKELMYHLTKLFSNIVIPNPTKIFVSYYDSATHVWKPSIDPYQMYKEIMQPIENENIFIVGEAYSLNQQWSEGAVQSVNDLMKILKRKIS